MPMTDSLIASSLHHPHFPITSRKRKMQHSETTISQFASASRELSPGRCLGCQQPLQPPYSGTESSCGENPPSSVLYRVGLSEFWHAECLRCDICCTDLSRLTSCFRREERIYCPADYHVLFPKTQRSGGWASQSSPNNSSHPSTTTSSSSTRSMQCITCKSLLTAQDLVFQSRPGQFHHMECFTCSVCRAPLVTGMLYLLDARDRLFCHAHFHHAAAPNTPTAVSKLPEGRPSKLEPYLEDRLASPPLNEDDFTWREKFAGYLMEQTGGCLHHQEDPSVREMAALVCAGSSTVTATVASATAGAASAISDLSSSSCHSLKHFTSPTSFTHSSSAVTVPTMDNKKDDYSYDEPKSHRDAEGEESGGGMLVEDMEGGEEDEEVAGDRTSQNELGDDADDAPHSTAGDQDGATSSVSMTSGLGNAQNNSKNSLCWDSLSSSETTTLTTAGGTTNASSSGKDATNTSSTTQSQQQGPQQRQKRIRTSFKHHQLRSMKAYFTVNHNPDAKDLKRLSQDTGLSKRVLQVWFQNARAKFRRTVQKQSEAAAAVTVGGGGCGQSQGEVHHPHHQHHHHQSMMGDLTSSMTEGTHCGGASGGNGTSSSALQRSLLTDMYLNMEMPNGNAAAAGPERSRVDLHLGIGSEQGDLDGAFGPGSLMDPAAHLWPHVPFRVFSPPLPHHEHPSHHLFYPTGNFGEELLPTSGGPTGSGLMSGGSGGPIPMNLMLPTSMPTGGLLSGYHAGPSSENAPHLWDTGVVATGGGLRR